MTFQIILLPISLVGKACFLLKMGYKTNNNLLLLTIYLALCLAKVAELFQHQETRCKTPLIMVQMLIDSKLVLEMSMKQ